MREIKFKKGDKCIVAIEPHSNAARGKDISLDNIDTWTYEGIIVIVGRKYITVNFKGIDSKFSIENDYKEKYEYGGANYKLYKNLQELKDEKRKENLLHQLFGPVYNRSNKVNNLTLDQLERINAIIEENNKE